MTWKEDFFKEFPELKPLMKKPKKQSNWLSYRSLLKSFYIAIDQKPKEDGGSAYATGWNDALDAVHRASEIWFSKMDKLD